MLQVILIVSILKSVCCTLPPVPAYYPTSKPLEPDEDYGEPLYLTPMIRSGEIELARNMSRVGLLPNVPMDVESYSGYLTINDTFDSNLFFWYFPAQENPDTAESMIWLQGGPGWTSLYGVFMESGPYRVYDNYNVSMSNYTWSKYFHVIYIDNPVGTGFSFTNSSEGYVRTGMEAANGLYEAIVQLFQIFPEFSKNDFYVAGESFAGKYLVNLATVLHLRKPAGVKFAGLIAGNPQLTYEFLKTGELLYSIGLANAKQKRVFDEGGEAFRKLVKKGKITEAAAIREALLYGGVANNEQTYFMNITGFATNTDFVYSLDPGNIMTFLDYISLPQYRRAVHVGANEFHSGKEVGSTLLDYYPGNEKLGKIMNNYKVMLYYGQYDIMLTYLASVDLMRFGMKTWNLHSEYDDADRQIWRVDPNDIQVAGYVTRVDKFSHVLVRNGGHMLPYYQPRAAQDMIRRFVKDIPFTNE